MQIQLPEDDEIMEEDDDSGNLDMSRSHSGSKQRSHLGSHDHDSSSIDFDKRSGSHHSGLNHHDLG